jgi:hypothetical protein
MTKYFVMSLIAFIPYVLFGQEEVSELYPIATDRPNMTASSLTLPKNTFQIETGVLYEYLDGYAFDIATLKYPTTLLRYGLLENFELRISGQYMDVNYIESVYYIWLPDDVKGEDNLEVGFKTHIAPEKGIRPEISLLSMFILPTGNGSFNSDAVIPTTMFLFSHSLSNKLSLAYNLGWQTIRTSIFSKGKGTGIYTLSLAYGITKSLGCYLEFYGNTVYPYSGTLQMAGGFVFLAANNFQLDFSGGRTAGSVDQFGESVYYLNLGVSFRIPR